MLRAGKESLFLAYLVGEKWTGGGECLGGGVPPSRSLDVAQV